MSQSVGTQCRCRTCMNTFDETFLEAILPYHFVRLGPAGGLGNKHSQIASDRHTVFRVRTGCKESTNIKVNIKVMVWTGCLGPPVSQQGSHRDCGAITGVIFGILFKLWLDSKRQCISYIMRRLDVTPGVRLTNFVHGAIACIHLGCLESPRAAVSALCRT